MLKSFKHIIWSVHWRICYKDGLLWTIHIKTLTDIYLIQVSPVSYTYQWQRGIRTWKDGGKIPFHWDSFNKYLLKVCCVQRSNSKPDIPSPGSHWAYILMKRGLRPLTLFLKRESYFLNLNPLKWDTNIRYKGGTPGSQLLLLGWSHGGGKLKPCQPVVSFDVSIGGQEVCRMKMELFADTVPKTGQEL